MKLVPLFEMVHKYVQMHPVKMQGQFGQESVSWLFREGTILGERVRGRHQAMNKSVLRADNVVTPDIRGILFTDDGESVYYEVRGYGIEVDGLRHFKGSMYFMTGAEKYIWLNTVLAVMEGRYRRAEDGLFIGTFQVYECIAETETVEPRATYHEGVEHPVH
ncbi:MAG TPA: DUF3237 family protein [Dehalococcoidia bacterium]|nr:DUF3237 family protein [Dehalococcoidia bacterium]